MVNDRPEPKTCGWVAGRGGRAGRWVIGWGGVVRGGRLGQRGECAGGKYILNEESGKTLAWPCQIFASTNQPAQPANHPSTRQPPAHPPTARQPLDTSPPTSRDLPCPSTASPPATSPPTHPQQLPTRTPAHPPIIPPPTHPGPAELTNPPADSTSLGATCPTAPARPPAQPPTCSPSQPPVHPPTYPPTLFLSPKNRNRLPSCPRTARPGSCAKQLGGLVGAEVLSGSRLGRWVGRVRDSLSAC